MKRIFILILLFLAFSGAGIIYLLLKSPQPIRQPDIADSESTDTLQTTYSALLNPVSSRTDIKTQPGNRSEQDKILLQQPKTGSPRLQTSGDSLIAESGEKVPVTVDEISREKALFEIGFVAYRKKEYDTARIYFEKAANLNYPDALFMLGYMYDLCKGVSQDQVRAAEYYLKAAELGNSIAQTNLAAMYKLGEGVKQDLDEAIRWYKKAIEQNNPNAMNCLGLMYAYGIGVPKDVVEGVRLYRRAAELDYAPAQYNLAIYYETGRGIKKDTVEAIRWYLKAAELGFAEAQYTLGMYYRDGTFVEKDLFEATYWMEKASKNNHGAAARELIPLKKLWEMDIEVVQKRR
jgi:tetratricopeptide (TPR) repeat protein